MAYYMQIEGMEEVSELLEELEKAAPGVAAQALYEGAAVMQHAIVSEMGRIRTEPFKYAKDGETRLPSPEEKEILEHAGVGIAKFDKNGAEVNTSVGFNQSGYADVSWNHMSSQARTNYKAVLMKGHTSNASSFLKAVGKASGTSVGKGAQNQKPIGVVANAINSGTSFMKKQPFVRTGMKKGSGPALAAIRAKIENAFLQITKGA